MPITWLLQYFFQARVSLLLISLWRYNFERVFLEDIRYEEAKETQYQPDEAVKYTPKSACIHKSFAI